jgi:hypothetical protein
VTDRDQYISDLSSREIAIALSPYNVGPSVVSLLRSLPHVMDTNSTLPPLLNPYTPLAFLPPQIAQQFQAQTYFDVATLSVCIHHYIRNARLIMIASAKAFIWDMLKTIPDDIKITKRKLHPTLFAYFISR